MTNRIGTCSLCGGPVSVSQYSVDMTPHCEHCGAMPKLPVIPMIRPVSKQEDTIPDDTNWPMWKW